MRQEMQPIGTIHNSQFTNPEIYNYFTNEYLSAFSSELPQSQRVWRDRCYSLFPPFFLSCLLVLFVLFRALDRRHTKCLWGMVHALVCRYETGGGYVKYQHGVPVRVAISPTYIEHRVTETAS